MDTNFALNSARMIRRLGDRAFAQAMVDCVTAANVDHDWGFAGRADHVEVDAILSKASELFLPAEWWMSPMMEVACRSAIGLEPINVIATPRISRFGTNAEVSFILGIGAITSWREVEVAMQFTTDGKSSTGGETLMVPAVINPARAMLVGFDGSSYIAT